MYLYATPKTRAAKVVYVYAMEEKESIGQCDIWLPHYWIMGLRVNPQYRKQGIATELLTFAIELGGKALFAGPFWDMPMDVKQLKQFYYKHGFVDVVEGPFPNWMVLQPIGRPNR